MKKIAFVFLPCLPFVVQLYAYESALLNLAAPVELDVYQSEFTLQHRFYTPLEDVSKTIFGKEASSGANPGFGLRLRLVKGIDVAGACSHHNPAKGFTIGAGYNFPIPKIKSDLRLDVEYFSFRPDPDRREGNAFILLAWQVDFIPNRIRPVINIGYNNYNEKVGVAGGAGLRLVKNLELIGEYCLATDPLEMENKNSFAFGFDYKTYGHHFMVVISNNTDLGVRRLMRGAPSNDLYAGFNIHRLLEF